METKIPGIGPKTEKLLEKLNLNTLRDLTRYYPRRYTKYPVPVLGRDALYGDMVAIMGQLVCDIKVLQKTSVATIKDSSGMRIGLLWFQTPYKRMQMGDIFVFYGKASEFRGELQLQQAQVYDVGEYAEMTKHMYPIYGLTNGLSQNTITKAVQYAVNNFTEEDILPKEIKEKYRLIDKDDAMRMIHLPADEKELKKAQNRIKFDEFFDFFMQIRITSSEPQKGAVLQRDDCCRKIVRNLPFSLTNAQQSAWEEVQRDIRSGYQMKRLLEGDVGSGKTILSFLALVMAVENGYQGALMAPTEVLAKQHYEDLVKLIEDNNLLINCSLLCGSTKKKKEEYKKIKENKVQIVIGTHALLQESVEFSNLALVVIDEQHRFGVEQRKAIYQKSKDAHILIMSATPIPRSLGQVLYSDLSISIVNERPANRKPIKNTVINKAQRKLAWQMIYKQVQEGRQAYVICPMVDDNPDREAESVTAYAQRMRQVFPESVAIGVLYGSMKAAEKNETMKAFAENTYQILISTTVVEVGVNVPNATVMLIEDANLFGLAQLHQLRGRVGRGEYQSYCIFMNGADDECERLKIMWNTNDGFKIAEEDMRLRGMGNLLGTEQSGNMAFGLADVYLDKKIMSAAKNEVDALFAADPSLSGHIELKKAYAV